MHVYSKKITTVLMLFVAAILIVWDLVVFLMGPSEATESHIILRFATDNFTLPFCMAGLLGHWFWPRDNPALGLSKAESFFLVVVPVVLFISALDIFYKTPMWALPLIAPVGYLFGSLFWPQRAIK